MTSMLFFWLLIYWQSDLKESVFTCNCRQTTSF